MARKKSKKPKSRKKSSKKKSKTKSVCGIERVCSGIDGLDPILGGGFEKNSNILVLGDTGTGKSTLLLQFLCNGAKKYREPGVFISFGEPKETFIRHMAGFGFDLEKLQDENMLQFVSYKPHEVKEIIDEGGGSIWDSINEIDAKRLAIDSLTAYTMLFQSPYQVRESQLFLFELLRKWDCTIMLSAEGMHDYSSRTMTGMEHITDCVMVLRNLKKNFARIRALEVLKMRGSDHGQKIYPFEFIEGKGIKVYPDDNIKSGKNKVGFSD